MTLLQISHSLGGLCPRPHHCFAPGPHWGTSVPHTPVFGGIAPKVVRGQMPVHRKDTGTKIYEESRDPDNGPWSPFIITWLTSAQQ